MEVEGSSGTDILGPKKLNYDFLMLVRDKKYPEALTLGRKILEIEPNNPSVKKFCDFILANNKELEKMVQEEEEYESVDSDDEEAEEGSAEEEEENENKAESSSDEDDEKSSDEEDDEEEEEEEPPKEEEKPKPKIELTTCSLNQFPHVCTRNHN